MKSALWLILAVGLGLIVYSPAGIVVNGFRLYVLYPALLGIINLAAFWMMKKGS